jgi:branched-chain amino acid transport system permease protein
VFTAGLGAVTYVGAIRHVLRGPALAQIIVTFGLLVLLQGAAQALFSANARGIPHPLADSFKLQLAGVVGGGPQLVAALGAVLCTGGVWALVNRTEVGSAIAAVAQDADAARLVGIDPNRIHLLAWAIGGASVGIAGALLMNFFSVDPVAGASFGLIAFVAVSLGGFGSLPGALVAGVALGVIQDLVGLYLPSYSLAAIFALYLVIVLVRPQGLFGTR